jgi:hypothetical protein
MLHRAIRRVGGVAAASALATAGLAFIAAPAHAQGVNIDQWLQAACGYRLCLWYHAGQGTGGAGWGTNTGVANIDDTSPSTFYIPGNPGNQGLNQRVRNNAGSMSNGSTSCLDYAYVSPGWFGDYNVVVAGWGGNLTNSPLLHNNEASVIVSC